MRRPPPENQQVLVTAPSVGLAGGLEPPRFLSHPQSPRVTCRGSSASRGPPETPRGRPVDSRAPLSGGTPRIPSRRGRRWREQRRNTASSEDVMGKAASASCARRTSRASRLSQRLRGDPAHLRGPERTLRHPDPGGACVQTSHCHTPGPPAAPQYTATFPAARSPSLLGAGPRRAEVCPGQVGGGGAWTGREPRRAATQSPLRGRGGQPLVPPVAALRAHLPPLHPNPTAISSRPSQATFSGFPTCGLARSLLETDSEGLPLSIILAPCPGAEPLKSPESARPARARCPSHRRPMRSSNPLSPRPTFHASSLRSVPHAVQRSHRFPPTPRTAHFPPLCGCARPGWRAPNPSLPIPHLLGPLSLAPREPLLSPRRPCGPRPSQLSPPAPPVAPARAPQWPPAFRLGTEDTRPPRPRLRALAPPPSSLTNLLAGRQEGAAVSGGWARGGECAPLGGAGRRGAGTALRRPRADWAQPDAAGLCPRRRRRRHRRRRRGRRALPDMLSFRTCPRGSYQARAAAGETQEPRAGGYHAGGRGGGGVENGWTRRAAKNSSCGSRWA
nr:proline-rich protein 36-like [Oryctolagus cuniculus]